MWVRVSERERGRQTRVRRPFIKAPGGEKSRSGGHSEEEEEGTTARGLLKGLRAGYDRTRETKLRDESGFESGAQNIVRVNQQRW